MSRSIITTILFCLAYLTYSQNLASIQTENEPLVLQSLGSFYVGGEKQFQSPSELGGFSSEGNVTINQMYVNYMIPQERKDNTSFVLIHGMNLSGKTWETTPDGRMGWYKYFVRKGYPVYVVDQVGAGRSGFNQKNYNLAREGNIAANSQQALQRISDENAWINFRFGLKNGQPVNKAKFPINAVDEFSKQSIPFSLFGLPEPNPNYVNLSELAQELEHTILVSHSQSGAFPIETALLNSTGIDGIVMLEPGGTGEQYTNEQVRKLASIPLLIIFGDNIQNETGIPDHSWKSYCDGWGNFTERINAAGGKAGLIYLPDMGIHGNSHMLMQDKNNKEIANIALDWLNDNK